MGQREIIDILNRYKGFVNTDVLKKEGVNNTGCISKMVERKEIIGYKRRTGNNFIWFIKSNPNFKDIDEV